MEKIRPIKRKWLDWLINTNAMGKEPEIIRNISRFFETKKKKHNGRINNNRIRKNKQRKRKNTMKDQLGMEQ